MTQDRSFSRDYRDKQCSFTSVVWFRGYDLRLEDNPALSAAVERGCGILPLFIWDLGATGDLKLGRMSKWWLLKSLRCLNIQLEKLGSQLVVLKGHAEEVLVSLVENVRAGTVFWNRGYDPFSVSLDRKVIEKMRELKVKVSIHEEETFSKGEDCQQFSSFMKLWLSFVRLKPFDKPETIPRWFVPYVDGISLDHLYNVEIENELSTRMKRMKWSPGCFAAKHNLRQFSSRLITCCENNSPTYISVWSKLSPHIRFGEITSRQAYYEFNKMSRSILKTGDSSSKEYWFLRKLCVRSFFRYSLLSHPPLSRSTFMEYFAHFPSKFHKHMYDSFIQGQTGYPIIDAAVRALRFGGWIHMSLRSILVKFFVFYLMLPWNVGSHWFYSNCIDAEFCTNMIFIENLLELSVKSPHSNVIYNSVASRRIDPFGKFIKHWVSELSKVDSEYIHSPWKASKAYLNSCGVKLGISYPFPILYPRLARKRAKEGLTFFQKVLSLQRIGRMSKVRCIVTSREGKRSYHRNSIYIEWKSTKYRKTCCDVCHAYSQHCECKILYLDNQPNHICNSVTTPALRISCDRQKLDLSPVSKNSGKGSTCLSSPSIRSPWLSVFDNWNMEEMNSPHILSPSPEFIYSLFHHEDIRNSGKLFNSERYDHQTILYSPYSHYIPGTGLSKNREFPLLSIDVSLPKQHPIHSYEVVDEKESVSVNGSFMQHCTISQNESVTVERQINSCSSGLTRQQLSLPRINPEDKRLILESIANDSSSIFRTLARFILCNYVLTESSSREYSKDFIRLRNIKKDYDKWKPRDTKSLTLTQMKQFFGAFLNLDVSNERDRHYHGGIRGPYVYGIKERLTQ